MEQRKQVIYIFFFGLLLFVSYQLLRIFSPFFQTFFLSAMLSFAFYPLHQLLKKAFKNETLSALTTTAVIVLAVFPPTLVVLTNLVGQTLDLYKEVRVYIKEGGVETFIQTIQSYGWFQTFQEKVLTSELLKENLSNILLKATQALANLATAQLGAITKNAFLIPVNVLLIIFFLFFLIRDGEKIYRFVYELTPMEDADRTVVFSKLNDVFAGVIRGQLFTSIMQGILAGVCFFFLQLPAPLFFGVATFFTSTIPITGASTVWVPFAAYLFLTHQIHKAIILTLIGIFVISLSDNILKPILIGEKTKIPVSLLFLGIFGGLRIYGMIGIFLGPIFITLFFALVKIYQARYDHQATRQG